MICYLLCTLMLAGIRKILVITTPTDASLFQNLLGDGSQWGVSLEYAEQARPNGIAEALLIGADFLAGQRSALILGDNIFYGRDLSGLLISASCRASGATIFAHPVTNPERYFVVSFDAGGHAVAGLYFYDGQASVVAQKILPSERGELEITDVNRAYLESGSLSVEVMGRGMAWLDMGTHESLLEAATFSEAVEKRQRLKICLPEETAYTMGFITAIDVRKLAQAMDGTPYGQYLIRMLTDQVF
jgi:glucose-1-phosphate thymidylyltransferase